MNVCSVDSCAKPAFKRGYCGPHYYRALTFGSPFAGSTFKGAPMTFIKDAVGQRTNKCLIWPFARNNRGYGVINGLLAHRVVCEIVNGPPPSSDHESAHSCGNGHLGCIAADHLRWATHTENMEDMFLHGRRTHKVLIEHRSKFHCIHGHEFTPENTYYPPRGSKVCKICKRAAFLRFKSKRG